MPKYEDDPTFAFFEAQLADITEPEKVRCPIPGLESAQLIIPLILEKKPWGHSVAGVEFESRSIDVPSKDGSTIYIREAKPPARALFLVRHLSYNEDLSAREFTDYAWGPTTINPLVRWGSESRDPNVDSQELDLGPLRDPDHIVEVYRLLNVAQDSGVYDRIMEASQDPMLDEYLRFVESEGGEAELTELLEVAYTLMGKHRLTYDQFESALNVHGDRLREAVDGEA